LDALPASLANISNTGVPANIPIVNCEQIQSKLMAIIESVELSLTVVPPRLCSDSELFQQRVYTHWFAFPLSQDRTPSGPLYDVRFATKFGLLSALSRIRLGCHNLQVSMGRHRRIERAQRFCEHCLKLGEQHVEDEQHFALECPRYHEIRTRFRDKLALHTDMHTLFTASDQLVLADFICQCLALHNHDHS
jgi:hypothetical protein